MQRQRRAMPDCVCGVLRAEPALTPAVILSRLDLNVGSDVLEIYHDAQARVPRRTYSRCWWPRLPPALARRAVCAARAAHVPPAGDAGQQLGQKSRPVQRRKGSMLLVARDSLLAAWSLYHGCTCRTPRIRRTFFACARTASSSPSTWPTRARWAPSCATSSPRHGALRAVFCYSGRRGATPLSPRGSARQEAHAEATLATRSRLQRGAKTVLVAQGRILYTPHAACSAGVTLGALVQLGEPPRRQQPQPGDVRPCVGPA